MVVDLNLSQPHTQQYMVVELTISAIAIYGGRVNLISATYTAIYGGKSTLSQLHTQQCMVVGLALSQPQQYMMVELTLFQPHTQQYMVVELT